MTKNQKISAALRTDLVGQRFGRLLVVEYVESRYGTPYWLCRCACGKEKAICGKSLKRGVTKSCGCWNKELTMARATTHGKSRTPQYSMWYSAKRRAKQKGLEFDLRAEDIRIPEYCPLLGLKLVPGKRKKTWNSPSLDRFDSTKGYTRDNIWVVSHRANTLKQNATFTELRTLAENMGKFHEIAKAVTGLDNG